jgi:molecular chaperone DnaK (HSP70)
MARLKFSIGIDLGTTNCALAYEALESDHAPSEVFLISQWDTLTRLTEASTLPSFLYLPSEREAALMAGANPNAWIAGRFARKKAAESPGRVVSSAKSWLGHHAVDRHAPFLPWRSDEIPPAQRISPVRASGLLLEYLRAGWDAQFAGQGADFQFNSQDVTITVPASFDAAAQGLTLNAARDAGFPESVRLLEEPQAAFYFWLEQNSDPSKIWDQFPEGDIHHLLVIDIGGGTSDFTLFQISRQSGTELPRIKRVAVSDHLLLGGDNIDLALAHQIEARLSKIPLIESQWSLLVARCRDLKERCLADPSGDLFPISIPGSGSSLLRNTLSSQIERSEIESIVLDGFFPRCGPDELPVRTDAGLREWALPYAKDSAITRYLADFLRGQPRVDAILFNGGSLHPEILRSRLREQIAGWQAGLLPRILENPEPSLAVARGAARFGGIVQRRSQRIEAGAARAIYLEVQRQPTKEEKTPLPVLLCILPRNALSEEEFRISDVGIELRVNRLVRFQAYYSTRRKTDSAGNFVDWNDRDFSRLPPLQTTAKFTEAILEAATLPVTITVRMNEIGLLQVACLSADPRRPGVWPLAFDLRPHEQSPEKELNQTGLDLNPGVETARLETAASRLKELFAQSPGPRQKISATEVFKNLEKTLGTVKTNWNWALIRSLWSPLYESASSRQKSADHEEAWLIVAGFLLRPGFGGAGDAVRMEEIWQIHLHGLAYPGRRIQVQQYILWRRIAGGLNRDRQESILLPELPKLRVQKNAPAELVRLAGALERISQTTKTELIDLFLEAASGLAAANQFCAPYLTALGLLLNRAPFYAGPEAVVPWIYVEKAFEALFDFDWSKPELAEIPILFLRAGRAVDVPGVDLPKSLRDRIAAKLEKSNVSALRVRRVRKFEPLIGTERASLFGESLPPGLVIGEGE